VIRALCLACALCATAPVLAHAHEPGAKTAKLHRNAPASFAAQPAKGTWAKCPVSGDIFQVDDETQFSTYQGRVHAFCCPDCKPDFDKEPGRFAKK